MTLTELAGRVGITVANLSVLHTGKARAIRFSTLDAICRELGCTPGDLLGWEATDEDAMRVRPPGRRTRTRGAERAGPPPGPATSASR
jgi:putative transcriptional regulator